LGLGWARQCTVHTACGLQPAAFAGARARRAEKQTVTRLLAGGEFGTSMDRRNEGEGEGGRVLWLLAIRPQYLVVPGPRDF
jgi:hypothetical protein